jgi:hypothetical protein
MYPLWRVELFSFDWKADKVGGINSPTRQRLRQFVERSGKGVLVNFLDHYERIVYHETKKA